MDDQAFGDKVESEQSVEYAFGLPVFSSSKAAELPSTPTMSRHS